MDIVSIARPLVDLGFELAGSPDEGGVLTEVTLTLGEKTRYDPRSDTDTAITSGTAVTLNAFKTQRRQDQLNEVTAGDEHLIINVTDLEAAGLTIDSVTTTHKAAIVGDTWNIVAVVPSITRRTIDVRIRR
jgi:hypothetical protein